jgi:hypothetical protein
LHGIGKEYKRHLYKVSEVYGEEGLKNSSVFEWHKWFKEISYVKITNEGNAQDFPQIQGYCSL